MCVRFENLAFSYILSPKLFWLNIHFLDFACALEELMTTQNI